MSDEALLEPSDETWAQAWERELLRRQMIEERGEGVYYSEREVRSYFETKFARQSLLGVHKEGRMHIHNIADVPAFTTKDGSEIRELLAHRNSAIRKQSLAEARLGPGMRTTPHYHPQTEEIYYILEGVGQMTIADIMREVGPGDAIAIPPGSVHTIKNHGPTMLKFLCCCAPGYEHADTVLLGPG